MLQKTEISGLIFIITVALFLRVLFIKDGSITFGFDQARDAYIAQSINRGDLKILGPSASTPGLYHGVLYFYLISPSYLSGRGDPLVTNIWLSIINILTVIPIFILGRLLFGSRVGLLAAFLFAISLDAVQYANWMSNPAPAVLTGSMFYLGLAMYIFKKHPRVGLIFTGIGLGLSAQFEIFLGYLFVPLIISLIVFKIRPPLKDILIFSIVFILATSTMIISYIKFGPTFISGFASLFNKGDPFSSWREFAPMLQLYLNRFGEYFYRGLLPFNVVVGGLFGLIVVGSTVYWTTHKKNHREFLFLLIMLLSHAFLIIFGGESTPFINAGLQTVVFILSAAFLWIVFSKQKLLISLLVILIAFSSLYAIFKYNPSGQTVFAIQRGLILKNELAAIDYTYKQSEGKGFSINTVTSPLWINTVWDYLYNWYGQKKYGFVPSFRGRDQVGQLGSLPRTSTLDNPFFLILEPLDGIPMRFVEDTISYENTFSQVIEEKKFGGVIVQKRELLKSLD